NGTVVSDTGTDAIIPAATDTNAGLLLPAEKTKLINIAVGATANSTDAFLLDRTNHTGTQAQSTITGLASDLALKADLVDGKIPSAQIPGSFDDVLEFADFASLPGTGEAGKIYVTIDDNNQYRWSGSIYAQLNGGLALGETSATAYRGDHGKAAYDHSLLTSGNPHNVTKADVGLGSVVDADTTTTANIADSLNKRFVTDANLTTLGNTSNTNTGDQSVFQNIAVAGQGNVIADTTTDTVTFVAGTNTTITTDPATDTITFSSTGMTPVLVNNAASPFAAVDKQIIGALSSTGAIAINLPASGEAAVIHLADKDFAANTNTITINPNGSDTVLGETSIELTTDGAYVGLAIAAGSTDWYLYFFSDNTDTGSNGYRKGDTFYLTTGTATPFVQSTGVTALDVELIGATGGGGGAEGNGAGTIAVGAAGGNGGGATKFIEIAEGETFSYTIGAAGQGANVGNFPGGAGGTTLFIGSVSGTVQVTGGGGGTGSIGTSGVDGALQGAPGVGSGGDFNITGNRSLSWVVQGGVLIVFPSNGSPLWGFGTATGSIGAGATSGGLGAAGVGGLSANDTSSYSGGGGFRGQIKITEYYDL
ncbi:MAG: hypothetical protein HC799_19390, partial [Limnothrix sp. RL_2_0]|nr:hypothetical protein [Limnothrix sp. RL_2_0]